MNKFSRPPVTYATADFCELLASSLQQASFISAVLSKYRGEDADLQRIDLRPILLRQQPCVQWVYHHRARDLTRNLSLADSGALLAELLVRGDFRHAHLHSSVESVALTITQRGQTQLRRQARASDDAVQRDEQHNRDKQRMLTLERPFLHSLGVTTAQHQLIPAMARKWKQINKFIEVFAAALQASSLADEKSLQVVDFGSGKGYLTFAIHDWLRNSRQVQAQVIGVELRPDMVHLCQGVIDGLGLVGLRMQQGDVRSWQPQALNVVIALHACDIATDHAIDLGVRGGADIIMCSPCCHKQIRPQLLAPHPLRPILQHGVHLGQAAEMLTDGLRALLLEAMGYDTQVFEFVALEHTNKNKMILAVKRQHARSPAVVLDQIAELKRFYGVREHCLETLLADRLRRATEVVADNPT